jgi:hypothetical protein
MQSVVVPLEGQAVREPVTVEEVMHRLHLATDGRTVNEEAIMQCIKYARGLAESRLNAPAVLTQYRMTVYFEPYEYVTSIPCIHNADEPATLTATRDGVDTELTEGTDYTNMPDEFVLSSELTEDLPDTLTILYSDGRYEPVEPVKEAVLSAACTMWQGQPADATAFDALDPYRRQNVI